MGVHSWLMAVMRVWLAMAAMAAMTQATTQATTMATTMATTQQVKLPERQNSGDNIHLKQHKRVRTSKHHICGRKALCLVLKNLFPARRHFKSQEAITLCTHGHFHYFDNLQPLLQHWEGPVSLAVHAPGDDFNRALAAIRWARECLREPQVAERVSFHLFTERHHLPRCHDDTGTALQSEAPSCSEPAPWENVVAAKTYRCKRRMTYPINTARNIAREAATTHWVLVSDIELYPSPGLNSAFLEMVRRDPGLFQSYPPKVFVLPEFEVDAESAPPQNKTQLVNMIVEGKAKLFHEDLCFSCHDFPGKAEWFAANESAGLHVLYTGKRTGQYGGWEATFIGTHAEPPYDERVTWEGGKDRLIHGYALCALDYEFLILDNAFLVHKPGMASTPIAREKNRFKHLSKTNNLLKAVILPELKNQYLNSSNCRIY